MSEPEESTPDEIAKGTSEYFNYLEECDSSECVYTWEAIMAGSILLYDFRECA
jgi:hypothetical protein